ncbi:MAG: hypothetical protein RO009_23200 [Pseudorhodoplanes sp.]|jgi:hypothetical protein|nr:hypothetical protein [Pseudorhodoplanes sp.]
MTRKIQEAIWYRDAAQLRDRGSDYLKGVYVTVHRISDGRDGVNRYALRHLDAVPGLSNDRVAQA